MSFERFPIEASHTMMFARAILDANPIYADSDYAANTEVGGVIAPPTFTMAVAQFDPTYRLRPRPGHAWFGSGKNATGHTPAADGGQSTGGGLHAEQHFVYHRPLRAGEVLVATNIEGKAWEKHGRRGGTLSFTESITEFRTVDGELVVTSTMVGVRTGQVVEQGA